MSVATRGVSSFVKPFSAIPGPKGLPFIGTTLDVLRFGGFSNQIHKYFEMRYKQYGPIYKEHFGRYAAVFIHDPADLEHMFRCEGRYPQRTEFPAWNLHRSDAGQALGVLLSDGEDWQRMRSCLNKPMMNTKVVQENSHHFLEVATDMVERISAKRTSDGELLDLRNELFTWSVESACTVLFERRLGCLSDNRPPEIHRFIRAMQTVLKHSEKLLFFPHEVAHKYNLPVWREFTSAWDDVFEIGGWYVDERVKAVEDARARGQEVGGLIASQMQPQISKKELLSSLIDLFGAALDTTSNTTMWALWLIASNPRVQQQMREEVDNVAPSGEEITHSHLQKLSYMKAAVKETLRLYPAAAVLSRVTQEDMVLRNYRVPAGTTINMNLIAIGSEKQLFPDPEAFQPERWLRDSADPIHPFAWLPFGFGVRACIGRRIAEQEMYSILSKILQRFEIERMDDAPIETGMTLLIYPKQPIRLRFKDRQKIINTI